MSLFTGPRELELAGDTGSALYLLPGEYITGGRGVQDVLTGPCAQAREMKRKHTLCLGRPKFTISLLAWAEILPLLFPLIFPTVLARTFSISCIVSAALDVRRRVGVEILFIAFGHLIGIDQPIALYALELCPHDVTTIHTGT